MLRSESEKMRKIAEHERITALLKDRHSEVKTQPFVSEKQDFEIRQNYESLISPVMIMNGYFYGVISLNWNWYFGQ